MWSSTITIVSAVPAPPTEMATPVGAHRIVLVTMAIVVTAFVLAAIRHWRRTGGPAFMLVLVGGLFCSFNEATVDVLGHCYFPRNGGLIAYTTFDRPVPVWVVLAYVAFFGGLTYLQVLWLQSGASHRAVWVGVGVFWVLNLLLELPILASGLYVYYGDQPLAVGGFPLIWLVTNSLGSLFAAVVITRLSWFFTGARQLLLIVVPFATYMASWVVTMPHFAITNTDAPMGVRTVVAAVSILLGLVSIDVFIRIGTGQWRFSPPSVPSAQPLPAVAPDSPGALRL